jgi:hypothetical protein
MFRSPPPARRLQFYGCREACFDGRPKLSELRKVLSGLGLSLARQIFKQAGMRCVLRDAIPASSTS